MSTEIRVAVCDDERTECDYLCALLSDWGEEADVRLECVTFKSAESFLFEYEENKNFDILLLDIQMGKMNGVELAERIRAEDNGVQIIFITGFSDYILRGYDVGALHFLLKPVEKEKLFKVLFKAKENLKKEEKYLLVPSDSGNVKIKLSDVFYIEAFGHESAIYLKEQNIISKLSVSRIETMLGAGFVHTHRSYIVNLEKVSGITASEVFLDGGKKIPVSRRLYTALNKAFIEFYRGDGK